MAKFEIFNGRDAQRGWTAPRFENLKNRHGFTDFDAIWHDDAVWPF